MIDEKRASLMKRCIVTRSSCATEDDGRDSSFFQTPLMKSLEQTCSFHAYAKSVRSKTSAGVDRDAVAHCRLLGPDTLGDLANLEADEGLEQTGTVHAPREAFVRQHLLGHLTVFLGASVGQLALNDLHVVKLIEIPLHLQHSTFLAEVRLGVGGELEAR